MILPLESVVTCWQLTGLGVFYTYFLALDWAFNLSLTSSLNVALIGSILVYLTNCQPAILPAENSRLEPKTLIVYGLSVMSLCSVALATCLFAQTDESRDKKSWMLKYLPKLSICLFFISYYTTRIGANFYIRAICKYRKENLSVSVASWIVTFIIFGFKLFEFEYFTKSLAACNVAFGFLFLSISFFINDRLFLAHGLFDHEVAQKFGLYATNQKIVLKHEEHRSFTSPDGITTYFLKNVANEKIAVKITFSNPESQLVPDDPSIRYIRGRGHLRIIVKRGPTPKANDRFFVFFTNNFSRQDDFKNFLTVVM